jgi:hypothetical protein
MAYSAELASVQSLSAGTERSLVVHRLGKPGAKPKSYIQAGLHGSLIPIARNIRVTVGSERRNGLYRKGLRSAGTMSVPYISTKAT